MKIALLLFVTASLAYADERSEFIKNLPPSQIAATVIHLQELTKDAQAQRDAAVEQNEFVTAKLAEVQQANEAARVLAAQAERDMEQLREWGNEQAKIATKALEDLKKANALAAHRGNIIGYALFGFGSFLILYLIPSIVPLQYRLAGGVLGGIGGFVIGRFLL